MTPMAAVQMVSGPRVPDNLDEAGRLIAAASAAGARLVVLPENFALMPLNDADRLAAAEPDGKGPMQDFLAAQARQHHVWLVGGTIPLSTKTAHKVRAACLVFDDQGKRVARYDKIHLFDVQLDNGEKYKESNNFEPGENIVVVETPYGKLGLAVCYDLRFPELFRRLLEKGAEIFAVPAAFTAHTGKAHWEVLLRARAIENLVYVIAAAQDGRHANGRETYGDSMVVSPWGEVLARLPHGAGSIMADCDRTRLQDVRKNLPSIRHRKLSI
ncbi:MAG: carbon-nitrogen hydrolase family protein [Sulfuricaulis sp.]|uniref:carbon-nitrogen hydrolase family protein n=1 Tax=Sulfuricaulis sp. TaxID=2003553 RepID=UPI0025E7A7A8|nr:carbon-nitrogen hydrolase family protein [Sulfuricaulis sp.]MCR4347030.1 carbon-nitrogen hydrolase family protein [Sulfuricaulis sp.]